MIQVDVIFKTGDVRRYTKNVGYSFGADEIKEILPVPSSYESAEQFAEVVETLNDMERFLDRNSDFLSSYEGDFQVWDRLLVLFNPGKPFVWCVREQGTSISILDKEQVEASQKHVSELMNYFINNHGGDSLCFVKTIKKDETYSRPSWIRRTTFRHALYKAERFLKGWESDL